MIMGGRGEDHHTLVVKINDLGVVDLARVVGPVLKINHAACFDHWHYGSHCLAYLYASDRADCEISGAYGP